MAKKLLIGSVILFGIGIIGLVIALSMVDLNKYKPKIEQIAKENSGYELKIDGDITVSFSPIGINIQNVNVALPNQEAFTKLKSFGVAIEFMPFLKQEIKVDYIVLDGLDVQIEKDKAGKFNFEVAKKEVQEPTKQVADTQKEPSSIPLVNISKVLLKNSHVSFVDKQNDTKAELKDIDVAINDIAYDSTKKDLKAVSFDADVTVPTISYQKYDIKDLHVKLSLHDAVADMTSMTYSIFGSNASGKARLDLSKTMPQVSLFQNIPDLKLQNFSKEILEKELLEGVLNFNLSLFATLDTPQNTKKSLNADILFSGKDIGIIGYDLDKIIGGYDKSQGIDVVDIGSFLVAGPVGFALSKSSDGASAYAGLQEGKTLLKDLHVKIKVADTKANLEDVALATGKNRVALQGALDIVNETFLDVKVGILDAKNCAKYSQSIEGTFTKPKVKIDEGTLNTVINMATSLFSKSKKLAGFTNENQECEVFYRGVVKQP
jgi:AsmA protein